MRASTGCKHSVTVRRPLLRSPVIDARRWPTLGALPPGVRGRRAELSVAAPNVRRVRTTGEKGAIVLIDCDTCTVRGPGCDDCVVTVLLGAPPGERGTEPTIVPLTRRQPLAVEEFCADAGVPAAVPGRRVAGGQRPGGPARPATGREPGREPELPAVVELDEVEHRAVRALADFGLVPPLRHQDASTGTPRNGTVPKRHVS